MTNDPRNENRSASGERTVFSSLLREHPTAFGIGFIFIGALMLYNRIYHSLYQMNIIPQWVYRMMRDVPNMAVALGIIALGVWLVRGKRTPAHREGRREEE